MIIKNPHNSDKVPFNLEAWSLIKNEKAELVYLTLKPGEKLDLHKNPFDVIFFVVSGSGILTIESDNLNLNQHDSIFIDQTKDRGWENNTEKDLILLVYKILS